MQLEIESLELKIENENQNISKRKKGKRNKKLDQISKENSYLKNSIEQKNKLIKEKDREMKVLINEVNKMTEKKIKSDIKNIKNKKADLKDDILKSLKESIEINDLKQKLHDSKNKVTAVRTLLKNKKKENESKDNEIKKEKEEKQNLKISHSELIQEKEAKIKHISEMSKEKDQISLTK